MRQFATACVALLIGGLIILSGSYGSTSNVSAQSPTHFVHLGEVEVVVQKANVRSGPGTQYFLIGQTTRGKTYHYVFTTSDGEWHQINFKDQIGWIAASNVEISSETSIILVTPTPLVFMTVPTPSK